MLWRDSHRSSCYPESFSEFTKSTKSVTYLASAFLHNYERAGVSAETERQENATYWYNNLTVGTSENQKIIDDAVAWAVEIANDDSHGYDQTNRWGLDYDCSSLVIQAFENAGCPVKTNGASYTGNMVDVFLNTGFVDVTSQVNLATGEGLKEGDVVWKSGHVEMIIQNGQIVGARINENGEVTGGETGDQTGQEIRVRAYYNYPWTIVLRLPADSSGGVIIERKKKKKKYNFILMNRRKRAKNG